MISFGLSEEQEVVREAMHDFAEQAVRPIARECDEEAEVPDDFLQQVWELGLTTTQVPAEFGGGGEARSPVTNALVLEELAWGDATLAAAALAPSLFVNAVLDHGNQAQQAALLPALCGERFATGAVATIEAGAFADPMLPRQIYLRVDATDEAGNIGTHILNQPIDTQGLAPRARILGFRPR